MSEYRVLPGSYENASTKECWRTCSACFRCSNKHRYTACAGCSGRHDPSGQMTPDEYDYCDCNNGILRWRDKRGKLSITKYKKNPFASSVVTENETEDERQWKQYLDDTREAMDNPTWDPIQITDEPYDTGFKVLPRDYGK